MKVCTGSESWALHVGFVSRKIRYNKKERKERWTNATGSGIPANRGVLFFSPLSTLLLLLFLFSLLTFSVLVLKTSGKERGQGLLGERASSQATEQSGRLLAKKKKQKQKKTKSSLCSLKIQVCPHLSARPNRFWILLIWSDVDRNQFSIRWAWIWSD